MFGLFKSDPLKKAQKRYQNKLTEAMNAQRSGDIQGFAVLSSEAEKLLKEIEVLEQGKSK